MVDGLATNWGINRNPCDQGVTNRNWGAVERALGDISETVNNIQNDVTILKGGDTTNITEVINNYFVTNPTVINNYISNYLTNYFSTLYANTIAFTLSSDLTLSGGFWQGTATVDHSWLGVAPGASVTVIDAGAKYRWMAPNGAKGVAIRASEDGTQYIIMNVRTIAPTIRFKAKDNFTTADASVRTDNIPRLFVEPHSPFDVFGSPIYIANMPTHSAGTYVFSGSVGWQAQAHLIYSESKPTGTTPIYEISQEECP